MNIGNFLYRHLVPDKHKPKAPIAYHNETIKLIEMTYRPNNNNDNNDKINGKQHYNHKLIESTKRK